MSNILRELDGWLNNKKEDYLNIVNNDFKIESYNVDKDIFFLKNKAIGNVFSVFIYSYLENVQNYLRNFDSRFTFSSYLNFIDFEKNNINEDIREYLLWMKCENFDELNALFSKEIKNVDPRKILDIVKYNDFLVKVSLEKKNLDAAYDFLLESANNVINKLSMLIDKTDCIKKESSHNKHYDTTFSHKLENWFNLSDSDKINDFLVISSYDINNQIISNSKKSAVKADFLHI